IFAVVDNNFKSRIVAQTILSNETSKSYRWVLQQTIEATGVQPGAFMIDADLGLESVVSEIYPDTYLSIVFGTLGVILKSSLQSFLLDPRKTTWAKAFTGQVFKAEIMSTQRFESINEEQFAGWFAAWREKIVLYMTPSLHTDQMNEAVIYHSKRISFEDLYNLTLEVVDNRAIEFEYDFHQIQFDELLEGVDYSLVAESEKAYFHIFLIPRRWYKDEFIDAVVADELFVRKKSLEKNSLTPSLPSFPDVADLWNIMLIEPLVQTAAKVIGRKQSIKGTLLGLACKCVEVVNYDDLNDSKILMEIFKKWIHTHEKAQYDKRTIEQELNDDQIAENNQDIESDQDTASDQDTENDQDIGTIQLDVQDPFKYIGKGHPPKSV
ncbi:29520_t:CDS:2, partial [Racocetra persica]